MKVLFYQCQKNKLVMDKVMKWLTDICVFKLQIVNVYFMEAVFNSISCHICQSIWHGDTERDY